MMWSADAAECLSRRPDERPHRRRSSAVAVLALIGVGAMIAGAASIARAETPPLALEPMTDGEAVGMGCMLVAVGVGAATIAAGGVALIAAGAGVGATGTAVAVPVVVATMAGGCTVGAVATPAFLWLTRQGHTIGNGVVGLLPTPEK